MSSQRNNYWEPIYEGLVAPYDQYDLEPDTFSSITGIKHKMVIISQLLTIKRKRCDGILFDHVDFASDLECDGRDKFVFSDCVFSMVAFNKTKWKNVKFIRCAFRGASFSIASFEYCDFRDCTFSQIGISSKEMKMSNCYIEPNVFILGAATNLDEAVLRENKTSGLYQKYRLTGTKAILAKKLLENRFVRDDERISIECVKLAQLLPIQYKIDKSLHDLRHGSIKAKLTAASNLMASEVDYLVVLFVGSMNGWGHMVSRPLAIAAASCILFSLYYYYHLPEPTTYLSSVIRSIEYWLLFGYTRYSFTGLDVADSLVVLFNGLLGMVWFATIIPVVIKRSSNEK